jgi:hypothetical protein
MGGAGKIQPSSQRSISTPAQLFPALFFTLKVVA